MKRQRDYSNDPNLSRAQRLLRSRKIALRGMKNLSAVKSNAMIPSKIRKNLRVSGLIGRFQPSSGNEYKFRDMYTTGGVRALVKTGDSVFYNSTPVPISIVSDIARGNGPDQRIGNDIVIKSINFKATVVLGDDAPATSFSGSYKIFIILDKQANGTTPAVTSIWAPGTASGGNASINSSLNMSNTARYSILKMFSGSLQANVYYDNTVPQLGRTSAQELINFSMKCNIPVRYESASTTGVVSTIQDNNIWVFAFSDDIGDTQLELINPNIRIRFTDN